jgi:hypothetical protein
MAEITGRLRGGTGVPFNSIADAIAEVGVEDELVFEGTATQFQLVGGSSEYPVDGRWAVEPQTEAPFRSRLHVVRPRDPAGFNGTVMVVWNNVSAGQDNFLTTGPQAVQLLRDGYAIVGVSAQKVGIEGHPDLLRSEADGAAVARPPALHQHDPERYGSLHHPGDGFSYDVFTQAARLLAPDRAGAIDPLGGLAVRHLVAMGGSQSATRLATYFNAIQPRTHAFDGFLLTVYAGCPNALDPATAPKELPQLPVENFVQLLEWRTYRLRDDLDVPTIVLNSEFEAEQCHPNHQADTDTVRWWEIAGTAHGGLMPASSMTEMAALMGDMNSVSFAPAFRASLHALQGWLDGGDPPPHQPRLWKQGEPPALPRDEHGNALGGIRWPDVEAPLATNVGETAPDGPANLMGHTTPFPPEKVRALYGDRQTWFAAYAAATARLVEAGVVLPDDAAEMLEEAGARGISI